LLPLAEVSNKAKRSQRRGGSPGEDRQGFHLPEREAAGAVNDIQVKHAHQPIGHLHRH
jgi:hypothetical protein